ncbi:MAG: hypothetical protein OCD02_09650 [Spirochaetaceae bacterium]
MVKILKGYSKILVESLKKLISIIKFFTFLLFVFATSILIVYPLWSLANTSPSKYTFVVLSTFGILIIGFFIFKLSVYTYKNGFKYTVKTIVWPFVKKILQISLTLLILLSSIYLYSTNVIFGLIFTGILFFVFGYFRFAFKK